MSGTAARTSSSSLSVMGVVVAVPSAKTWSVMSAAARDVCAVRCKCAAVVAAVFDSCVSTGEKTSCAKRAPPMGGLLARFHCNVKRRSVEESSKDRSSKIDENPFSGKIFVSILHQQRRADPRTRQGPFCAV